MEMGPEYVDRMATRAGHLGRAAEAVQKLGFGQRVDAVVELGRTVPRVTLSDAFKPHFEPRLGPLGGGGSVIVTEVHGVPTHVARIGGRAGTNFAERLSQDNAVSGAFDGWEAASSRLGQAATVYGAVASGWQQWNDDSATSDDTVERATRAAFRSATVTTAGYAGGAGGRMLGSAIGGVLGSLVCPGVGTTIGATIGGLGGGYVGGTAAAKLADGVVDGSIDSAGRWDGEQFVTDVADTVSDMAEEAADRCGEFINDAFDSLDDAVTDILEGVDEALGEIADGIESVAESVGHALKSFFGFG